MEYIDIKSTVENMIYILDNIHGHMDELNLRMSMADKAVVDIKHECELSVLDESEMVESWKLLRSSLKARRVVQDELRLLGHFRTFANNNKDLLTTLTNLSNTISQVETNNKNRQYRPRVMTGLKICQKEVV